MKLLLLSLSLTCSLLAQDPFQVKVIGHGQAMILIPGLSSSGETWDTTVAHYQDRFQCHVLTVAGFERIVGWGLASDRTAVADAMCELFAADLRDDLANIKIPTLVLGTWIGASQYTGRQRTEANLRRQYAKLAGYLLFSLYSIALTDLFRGEIRRRQWLTAPSPRMYARVFGAALLVAAVQTFLVISITWMFDGQRSAFLHPATAMAAWLGITAITILSTIFYIAATAPRRFREKEVHLQLALREAELRALEAQVNPHFLFNCLNSIRGLVVENPAVAQDMITRLANILRYNLHRDPMHTVPLASEVEVVGDYLALESIRLEDRLRVQFASNPEAGQVPIPPMFLQTLVENALKHGIAKLLAGGDLLISAVLKPGALVVEVENSGQLAEARPEATQLGLANVRQRLRILYGDRVSLQLQNRDGRVAATVLIPRVA